MIDESRKKVTGYKKDRRRQYDVLQQCWMTLSVYDLGLFFALPFLGYPISLAAFFSSC
jgi:hypothetical protein